MSARWRGRPSAACVRALFALVVAAGSSATSEALANGRFPRAERLIEDPANPDHLMLAATFGLVTTTDRGKHWFHICEAAFASDSSYLGDPLLELVSGDAWLVDVQTTIRRSQDGCTWTSTLGSVGVGAPNQNVNDLVVDRANRSTVVAVVTRIVDGGTSIGLEQSDDAGVTWRTIGSPLPLASVTTIDLDPTDPTHIYATGLAPAIAGGTGALLKSSDHGTTWSTIPIPNTDSDNVPYIAAIDPRDPTKMYVRTDSYVLPAGAPEESDNDALLYSKDGGTSWTEVLRKSAKLLGFALSPDGSSVLAGYGDPVEAGYYADTADFGIYEAQASDLSFSLVFGGSVTGLTWASDGVYAGTAPQTSGRGGELLFFAGGNIAPDGAAPTSLMALGDVAGPPPCCAALGSVCDWSSVCMTYPFFACADGGVPSGVCTDASAPLVDAGADVLAEAGIDDAATAPDSAAPQADASSGGSIPAGPPVGSGSGCACRVSVEANGKAATGLFWGAGLLCAMALRRRAGLALGRRRA